MDHSFLRRPLAPEPYIWMRNPGRPRCTKPPAPGAKPSQPRNPPSTLARLGNGERFIVRALFHHQVGAADSHKSRAPSHCCQPVGDDRFREQMGLRYGTKLGRTARGRPKKEKTEVVNE